MKSSIIVEVDVLWISGSKALSDVTYVNVSMDQRVVMEKRLTTVRLPLFLSFECRKNPSIKGLEF